MLKACLRERNAREFFLKVEPPASRSGLRDSSARGPGVPHQRLPYILKCQKMHDGPAPENLFAVSPFTAEMIVVR